MRARHNPFATGRVHGLGFLLPEDAWRELDRRLESLGYTAAIVGPCGSGKTTLLEELERRLNQAGIQTRKIFISRDVRVPWCEVRDSAVSLPTGGVLLVDGLDHLPWPRRVPLRRLALRRRIGLLATSHRAGLLPTCYRCRPDVRLLGDVVERLLGQALAPQRLERLFAAHGGNLRLCLRQLYDEAAAQPGWAPPESSTALS